MRIATYNVQWFDALFDQNSQLMLDQNWSKRHAVKRVDQANALAHVFRKIDADMILIVEAPNTGGKQSSTQALQNFAKHYGLRQSVAISGFESHTDQELTVLYDPKVVEMNHDPQGEFSDGSTITRAPRFDGKFKLDIDLDGQPDVHTFSKPPVELAVTHRKTGKIFRLIGVHAKSKAAHGAKNEREITEISIANRRKQLAQCLWLRERVEDHINANDSVIVLGDLNDGPGLDGYEKLFGKSSVEIVLGDANHPDTHLTDPHAQIWLDPRQGWSICTARFYSSQHKRYLNALLDYIMLSPDLVRDHSPTWRVYHPFDDPKCYDDKGFRDALLTASDHFPVCVDLSL
ncbi:MAG: endonuclease/exonuclease/phosphatase family protein [Rhodobacteraceae bacterium]|nr:endonuclease/exonuclease/phosphatase family protein [Paracoccaceae bacterium]